MRIVAVDAGDLPFQQRHGRALLELGALHLVALETGFIDRLPRGQAARGEVGHRVVAIAAAQIVGFVNRVMPEYPLSALMAGQALGILLRNGRAAFAGKADDSAEICGLLDMVRTGAVTGFAALRLAAVARVDTEHL